MAVPFGKYELLERIPSAPDDECYWSRLRGPAGFEKIVFVRRFDRERLDQATLEAIKLQAWIQMRGVSQIFELGVMEGWGFVVSELVVGASIATLAKRSERIPWLVAIAIVFDACTRMARIMERPVGPMQEDPPDCAITPARVILSMAGEVSLALGIPAKQRPPWHRTLCDVIHPILSLAATDEERELLRELFTDEDPDSVWVASDALVLRHPELDPVLPLVFLSLAGRIDKATAHRMLVERVPIEQLRALWNHVGATLAACSRTGSRIG